MKYSETVKQEMIYTLDVIADNIKRLMKRDDVSHRELENRSGISKRTLGKILKGEKTISIGQLMMIADSFDITITYFFTEHRYESITD